MKKLQFIMLSTLLTAGSTEFTQAMWGKPVEAKAPVAVEPPVEAQKANNAKTSRIVEQSSKQTEAAKQYAETAKQVKPNSNFLDQAYDATVGKAYNWMTGKPDVTATTVTTGSVDLSSTTKPRANSAPVEPTQTSVDTRSRSNSAPEFGYDINGKPNRTKLAQTLDLQKNPKDANGVSRKSTSPTTVTATNLQQDISTKTQDFLKNTPSADTVQKQANDASAQADAAFKKKPAPTSTSWFSGSSSK